MSKPLLIVANHNYSSWSLRPYLALSHAAIPFDMKRLDLNSSSFKQDLAAFGGAGKVPVLMTDQGAIWESLAICEYAAELKPRLWPADPWLRAEARAVSCEMHAGFTALRSQLPMNIRGRRQVAMTDSLRADLDRLFQLWQHCRQRSLARGPWLYGDYSIADAMFAPVITRLQTYGISCPPLLASYRDAQLADPHLQAWSRLAEQEPEHMAADTLGEPV